MNEEERDEQKSEQARDETRETERHDKIENAIRKLRFALAGTAPVSKNILIKEAIKILEKSND